jgi:hypothetical protein
MLYYRAERPILEFLKSRFTYPRTGYVQPPEEFDPSCRSTLVTLSLRPVSKPNENVTFFRQRLTLAVWWTFFVFLEPGNTHGRWFLPTMMVLLAVLVFVVSRRLEHRYSWWSAAILAFAGVPFVWWQVSSIQKPLVALLLAGVWLLGQGLATLVGYLLAHPLPPVREGIV